MRMLEQPLAGAAGRTRSAILAAAAAVLGTNSLATIADIARAADVGRTTVHRYFPDREALLYAATSDSIRVLSQSLAQAAPSEGPAREAMHRVIAGMVAVRDRILFLFGDPAIVRDISPDDMPSEGPLMELIERGQREHVFDDELSPTWIEHTLFALVYRGCQDAAAGALPIHAVAPTVIRTFESGVRKP
ncbi:transcriptional regulator [Mycobacterium sp. JS623]|uniref:TetR/AcrR family transcriptional regulator n=1 Tax=Mycobacterium sp. JS623 TaxID=212767 RepID=UPI0002A555CD|nr:TetR/AcrR family transcriptional regulator [Mycobacterium sp. JS623]AGB22179.1 transcriptional regulator [Mycobacterium sp. JS623]